MDNDENKNNNFNNIINIEEDDSIKFSIDSEDINDENISFDKNEYYEEISYNSNFDLDLLDNDINFEDEDILNLSNISSTNFKENIKDSNQDFFNIKNIKKDRGLLSLFTLNIIIYLQIQRIYYYLIEQILPLILVIFWKMIIIKLKKLNIQKYKKLFYNILKYYNLGLSKFRIYY